MFGLFKKQPTPGKPSRDVIVPRLKPLSFLDVHNQVGGGEEGRPITEPFTKELVVTYAFDLPDAFQMVSLLDCQELGLDPARLRSLALDNLRRQLPPIKIEGKPPIYLVNVGNDLEACLLLLDEVWDDFGPQVPGEIVVAVPGRNMLMFTSSEWQDVVAQMRALAQETVQKFPVHSLTGSLLVRRGGKWVEY